MLKTAKPGKVKSKIDPTVGKLKSSTHPNYKEVTVEMTDGTKFKTRSTYSGDYLKLDIDPKTHPAWTKEANYVNAKATEVSKFNDKFKGLSFGTKKES